MDYPIIRPTLVYIIRLWAEPGAESWVWRVSLQPVLTSEQIAPLGFASLEGALVYLQEQMVAQQWTSGLTTQTKGE